MYNDMYEQGGITGRPNGRAVLGQLQGGTAGSAQAPPMLPDPVAAPPAMPAPDAAPAAAKSGLGQYASSLAGWDAGKLNSDHNSPKYQIGRTLSQFDPHGGLSPDVLAALNGLGLGQFSANGDGLSVANGSPELGGMSSWDSIQGAKGSDPRWQFGVDSNLDTPAAGAGAGARQAAIQGAGGTSLPQVLSGDPLAAIQAAIGKYAGGGENIKAILAGLQGGGQ